MVVFSRFSPVGNLTEEHVMNYTYYMYQHTTAHLSNLAQPIQNEELKMAVKSVIIVFGFLHVVWCGVVARRL